MDVEEATGAVSFVRGVADTINLIGTVGRYRCTRFT
jgi:hypothetical protein